MDKKGSIALVILGLVAVIAIAGMILLFAGRGSITGNSLVTASSCWDSDGGKNHNSRGSIGVGIYAVEDTCLRFPDRAYAGPGNFVKEGVYLAEGYCKNENKTAFEVYECPNGCINGVCV